MVSEKMLDMMERSKSKHGLTKSEFVIKEMKAYKIREKKRMLHQGFSEDFIEKMFKEYDFTKPHKKMGVFREFNCNECNNVITYLYIPKRVSEKKSELNAGSTMKIEISPRVVCEDFCKECAVELKLQLKKVEGGARIL